MSKYGTDDDKLAFLIHQADYPKYPYDLDELDISLTVYEQIFIKGFNAGYDVGEEEAKDENYNTGYDAGYHARVIEEKQ